MVSSAVTHRFTMHTTSRKGIANKLWPANKDTSKQISWFLLYFFLQFQAGSKNNLKNQLRAESYHPLQEA
jgi:hypothetical protein